MKTKLVAFILAAASVAHINTVNGSTQRGWGTKETQRTILGTVLGTTIGSVIGHQTGDRNEGAIIGGVIGTVIGNRSGAGSDSREEMRREQAQWEQKKLDLARKQRAQELHYQSLRTKQKYSQPSYSRTNSIGDLYSDPELVAARQRAEQAELELERRREFQRLQAEKARLLQEYRMREREANQALNR